MNAQSDVSFGNTANIFETTDAKTTSNKQWKDIEISSTGKYQIAVVGGGSYTYNDNTSWYQNASVDTGNVWISTDYGENWTELTGDNKVSGAEQQWISAMISGDGSIMMVKGRGNLLYRSTNYGGNWTQINYTYNDIENYVDGAGVNGIPMKMATDGNKLFTYYKTGGSGTNQLFTFIKSTDGGSNWTTSSSGDAAHDRRIQTINTSKSGQYVIIFSTNYGVAYSADYGGTFIFLTNSSTFTISDAGVRVAVGCISNTGKIAYASNSNFYTADVTTGTLTGVSPNLANDAVLNDRGAWNPGRRYIMNSSNDGKYIMASGGFTYSMLLSVNYGNNWFHTYENSSFATDPVNSNEILGCRFSDDNKYVAVVQNGGFIYVHNNEIFINNPNSITYFGANTTLKPNTGITFPDGTTLDSSNKESDGTTFKASKFNNMTAIGDFSSTTAVAVTSDYRIKTNIETLDETHIVDNLRPVKYKQTQTGKNDIGFLAHELQEHYPELVEGEKDGDKMQSVNYNGLLPILINEVQQLKKQIAETRARIHSETS